MAKARTSKTDPFISLEHWLAKLKGARVAVVGDFAVDHYLVGKTSRISREAPVLIVKKREDYIRAGQAGNSAANLAALGARCLAFGFVGADALGKRLVAEMRALGVETSGMIAAEGESIVKTRVLAGAHHTTLQQVIRMDDDEGLRIGDGARRRLRAAIEKALPDLDAILVSDYGYGAVDLALWDRLGEPRKGGRGAAKPPLRILDSRHALGVFLDADVITPNETEVFEHLGIERFTGADPAAAGRRLIEQTRCRGLVMTRGNEGMLVFSGGAPESVPIFGTDEATDVTGAGDTVAAVVAAASAAGAPLIEAARLANVAAGIKVMKRGAATVSPEEIRRALRDRAAT